MKNFSVGIGALIAITVALLQGPQVDSAEQVSSSSLKGGGPCVYDGYQSLTCAEVNGYCTGGNFVAASNNGLTGGGSHQETGQTLTTGNCTGTSQCPATQNTRELTQVGCGG